MVSKTLMVTNPMVVRHRQVPEAPKPEVVTVMAIMGALEPRVAAPIAGAARLL